MDTYRKFGLGSIALVLVLFFLIYPFVHARGAEVLPPVATDVVKVCEDRVIPHDVEKSVMLQIGHCDSDGDEDFINQTGKTGRIGSVVPAATQAPRVISLAKYFN